MTTILLIVAYLSLTGSLQLLTVNLQNPHTLKNLSIMNFATLTGPFIKIRVVITLVIFTPVISTGIIATMLHVEPFLLILVAFSLLVSVILSHSSLKNATKSITILVILVIWLMNLLIRYVIHS